MSQFGPSCDDSVSFYGPVVHHAYLALQDVIASFADVIGVIAPIGASVQVEDYLSQPFSWECVLMYSCAQGGAEFCFHTAFLQHDRIVSWPGLFLFVCEMLWKFSFGQHLAGDVSCPWHQADVYQVRASRSAQVRVCEAIDDVLVIVVSATGVPGHHLLSLGTQLYHSLWHGGSWEGTAAQGSCGVGLRTDEWIYVLGVIRCLCGQGEKCGQCERDFPFHVK